MQEETYLITIFEIRNFVRRTQHLVNKEHKPNNSGTEGVFCYTSECIWITIKIK